MSGEFTDVPQYNLSAAQSPGQAETGGSGADFPVLHGVIPQRLTAVAPVNAERLDGVAGSSDSSGVDTRRLIAQATRRITTASGVLPTAEAAAAPAEPPDESVPAATGGGGAPPVPPTDETPTPAPLPDEGPFGPHFSYSPDRVRADIADACDEVDRHLSNDPSLDEKTVWENHTAGGVALRQLIAHPDGIQDLEELKARAMTDDPEVRKFDEVVGRVVEAAAEEHPEGITERWPHLAKGVEAQQRALMAAAPLGRSALARALSYEGIPTVSALRDFLGEPNEGGQDTAPRHLLRVTIDTDEDKVHFEMGDQEISKTLIRRGKNAPEAITRRARTMDAILDRVTAGPLSDAGFRSLIKGVPGNTAADYYNIQEWLCNRFSGNHPPLLDRIYSDPEEMRHVAAFRVHPDWFITRR